MKREFFIAGGGGVPHSYGYGYWTGPDDDLLTIRPDLTDDKYLSPMCRTKWLAALAFWLKKFALVLRLL